MGWTILYIAFGIVALWLLGEVLLQYKARLRWRLLAFAGFLGVVLGVLLPSVIVIGVGAIAFAIGQTYVTLSFRQGFSRGWALTPPALSGRRKDAAMTPMEPTLEVSDLEAHPVEEPEGAAAPEVHHPQPIPDDTGQYGVYTDSAHGTGPQSPYAESQSPYAGSQGAYAESQGAYAESQSVYADQQSLYATYGDYGQDSYAAQAQAGYAGQAQGGYAAQYDYGNGQYAAYSDPYVANGVDSTQQYDPYGAYGGQQYDYGTGQYTADPYVAAAPPYSDTPPGGVWVPQQREDDQPPAPPAQEEQTYPYQPDYNTGYGEYRY
ncbi:hypothetical protein [Streptomyces sp. 8N706]|uniref:hypothetical protein n=1 Tax=Streptomyces sp. 8N706 TaxID=3457416 RepID=UPI003FD22EDD